MVSMSVEELRFFYQVPNDISLEFSDGPAFSTVGEVDSAVYFTREQIVAGLRFLVGQAIPTCHPSTSCAYSTERFWILMGCSVLKLINQLDISLVEICFIYTLKLGTEGWLSMSAHSPRLQFVNVLPDSPKKKAKGVVLVRGPWYEMPGSLGLPFDVNQSLMFPGLS